MKENEINMLKTINNYFVNRAILCENEYHRYDAYNNVYIIELKYRYAKYDNWIIEFDKYAYNKCYSEINNKTFLYAVGYKNKIWIYNISELNQAGYNYNWEERDMPKQTEFDNNYDICKYVGYLEFSAVKQIITMEN